MTTRRIEDIDKNFKVATLGQENVVFLDPTQAPFSLHGFGWYAADGALCRLPKRILEDPSVNSGARALAWHTSGGRVRFRTDSKIVGVRAALTEAVAMNHMPRSGSCGFDLYIGAGPDAEFRGKAIPPPNAYEYSLAMFIARTAEFRDYTINFPLYNGLKEVRIALSPDASIEPPRALTVPKPILFYGSSITQGGCASRPGNAYTHILTNWLDADLINLGFSGSARGEPAMARAIAELDLSCFAMDYDHNAPNVEHLENTHGPFFKIIREKHPLLPVVMISRPDIDHEKYADSVARREVIHRTYADALAAGDQNVYFVDGECLFGSRSRYLCAVDGCHPNDLGFYRMAEAIYPVMKKALGRTL